MARILKVPYLGTAEDDVLLAEWFVAEGESFKKGQAVAAVETLKASFEVEAEDDGVLLRQLAEEGQRVPLQAPLAVAGDAGEQIGDGALEELIAAAQPLAVADDLDVSAPVVPSPSARTDTGTAAPLARRRAHELGVDLANVRGTGKDGLIRLEDVEAAASGAAASTGPRDGALDPGFLEHVRRDQAAFAALASEFKVALYRQHGAILGDGSHIAAGAVLLVDRLVCGARAYFGADTVVEAKELQAGELLHFGRRCRVRCTRMEFGDNAFLTDDIDIGGGGALEPEAELVVGSHGFVGEHVHLNPCRRLELGDEVVISRSAVIMTHSFGGSILAGYPNRFAGVKIGSFAQVGIQATLFPGVEMGEGSILLSGSSLVSAVPPGRLFGGVPATDLKAASQQLSVDDCAGIAAELVAEFARQLELRGRAVERAELDGELRLTVEGAHVLRFSRGAVGDIGDAVAEELRVAVVFDDAAWASQPSDVIAIDLQAPRIQGPAGPLADAFREFLRKRGVRLRPRSWAYKGGWL